MNQFEKQRDSEEKASQPIKIILKCNTAAAYVAAFYQEEDFVSPFRTSMASKGKLLAYFLSAFISVFPDFQEVLFMNNNMMSDLLCKKYSLIFDRRKFTSYKSIHISRIMDEVFIFLVYISKKYNANFAETWIKERLVIMHKHNQSNDKNIPKRGNTAKVIADFWAENPNFKSLLLKYFIQYKLDQKCKFKLALLRNVKMILAWADMKIYYESYKYVKYGFPLLNLNPTFLKQAVSLMEVYQKDNETKEKKELQPYLKALGLTRPEHDISLYPDIAYAAIRYFKKKYPSKSRFPEPHLECELGRQFLNKFCHETIKFEFQLPLPTKENLEMMAALGLFNNVFNSYHHLFEKYDNSFNIINNETRTLLINVGINPFAYILAILNNGNYDNVLADKLKEITITCSMIQPRSILPQLTIPCDENMMSAECVTLIPDCSRCPILRIDHRNII